MSATGQVLVLFCLVIAGFVCAKIKLFDERAEEAFSTLVLSVTLPAMILASFQRPFSDELLDQAGIAFGASAIIYAISFLIAIPYPHLIGMRGPERGPHRFAVLFSNVGFIGYPMIEVILGREYFFHLSVFNILFNILAYSVGAWLIAKEYRDDSGGKIKLSVTWKTFVNVRTVSTFIGIIMFLFSIKLPAPVEKSLSMAGDITSPLSMVIIGLLLSHVDIKSMAGRWRIYLTTAIRLVIMPAIVMIVFYTIGLRGSLLWLVVIVTAMPAATATSILASSYKVAPHEASAVVFLTTALSIVTVPLCLSALERVCPF